MGESSRKVRVFVSYSQDSRSHRIAVEGLADGLEKAGFSVFLDQWVDHPPSSWPLLIEQEFRSADVVLCVCTPTYSERVDGEVPGGTGRGATQEGSMVREEGYDLKMRADRFRVVHIEGSELSVHLALGGKGTHYFRWPDGRDSLLDVLRKPTQRGQIVEALERVFEDDVEQLSEWAASFVALGSDQVLDFDGRARRIAYEVLRLDRAITQRDTLASQAELVGDPHRQPLDVLAKVLKLGTLPRGVGDNARSRRRAAPTTPTAGASPPVPEAELERYLAKAKAKHETIQPIGFEIKVRAKVQLDDLYVPLDAVIDRGGRARDVYGSAQLAEVGKLEAASLYRQDVPLAEAFTHAKAMGRRGVIVLGDPGSGKTTHLKQVLLKVIADGPESIGLSSGTVPVFLSLRELPKDRGDGLRVSFRSSSATPCSTWRRTSAGACASGANYCCCSMGSTKWRTPRNEPRWHGGSRRCSWPRPIVPCW